MEEQIKKPSAGKLAILIAVIVVAVIIIAVCVVALIFTTKASALADGAKLNLDMKVEQLETDSLYYKVVTVLGATETKVKGSYSDGALLADITLDGDDDPITAVYIDDSLACANVQMLYERVKDTVSGFNFMLAQGIPDWSDASYVSLDQIYEIFDLKAGIMGDGAGIEKIKRTDYDGEEGLTYFLVYTDADMTVYFGVDIMSILSDKTDIDIVIEDEVAGIRVSLTGTASQSDSAKEIEKPDLLSEESVETLKNIVSVLKSVMSGLTFLTGG